MRVYSLQTLYRLDPIKRSAVSINILLYDNDNYKTSMTFISINAYELFESKAGRLEDIIM